MLFDFNVLVEGFEFSPLLAPLLIYLVTAGIKSLFGSISGKGSMLVASAVGALLLFGESVIASLGPEAAEIATSVVQLFLVIMSGFGMHDVVKKEIGKR